MLEVGKINKSQETKTSKTSKTTSGAKFSDYLTDINKPQTSSVSTTSGINIANAIFATQTISEEEERKKRQQNIKRGISLIEKLEEIRDDILLNEFSKDRLIEISRFVKKATEACNDAKLNDIIAEIELRVEVELAKLETLIEW